MLTFGLAITVLGLVAAAGKLSLGGRYVPFPILLTLTVGWFSIFSAALLRLPISQRDKWVLVCLLSFGFSILSVSGARFRARRVAMTRNQKVGLTLLFLVLFGLTTIIGARQGWHLTHEGASPHFRFPFHDDVERNQVLAETLAQGSHESPFLARSPLNYQVYWHSLAAFFIAGNDALDNGPAVMGVARATGLIFFLVFIWMALTLRPGLALRTRVGLPLLLLFFLHADIYNAAVTAIFEGRVGMEADWSTARAGYFRFISLPLLELTAPHHLFFFLFALSYHAVVFFRGRMRILNGARLASSLQLFAFLASPVLFVLFVLLPSAWRFVSLREFRAFLRFSGTVVLSAVVYFLAFGSSVLDLFFRGEATQLDWWPAMGGEGWLGPLVSVTSLGPLGLTLIFWVFLLRKKKSAWKSPWIPLLVLGLIAFHFVLSSPEIRRHFGWVALFFFYLSLLEQAGRKRLVQLEDVPLAILPLAVALHSYFVVSYLVKPSLVPPTADWRNYFEMGRRLRESPKLWRVMAAVNSEEGILMSPLARWVPCFSLPLHAIIHSSPSSSQMESLKLARFDSTPVAYTRDLGYNAILWDGIAEATWGERVKNRFIDESQLILRVGNLSLYRFVDKLKDAEADPRHLAATLSAQGWHFEAVNAFHKLSKSEWTAESHRQISRSLRALGAFAAAKHHAELAGDSGNSNEKTVR